MSKFLSSSAYVVQWMSLAVDKLHSETKIDRIERRLEGIEHALRRLTTLMSDTGTKQATGRSPPDQDLSWPLEKHRHLSPHQYTRALASASGDDGLMTESITAKSFLEHTVGRDPLVQKDPQLLSSIESLRAIAIHPNASHNKSDPGTWAAFTPDLSSSNATPPKWEQIKPLVERARRVFRRLHSLAAIALH